MAESNDNTSFWRSLPGMGRLIDYFSKDRDLGDIGGLSELERRTLSDLERDEMGVDTRLFLNYTYFFLRMEQGRFRDARRAVVRYLREEGEAEELRLRKMGTITNSLRGDGFVMALPFQDQKGVLRKAYVIKVGDERKIDLELRMYGAMNELAQEMGVHREELSRRGYSTDLLPYIHHTDVKGGAGIMLLEMAVTEDGKVESLYEAMLRMDPPNRRMHREESLKALGWWQSYMTLKRQAAILEGIGLEPVERNFGEDLRRNFIGNLDSLAYQGHITSDDLAATLSYFDVHDMSTPFWDLFQVNTRMHLGQLHMETDFDKSDLVTTEAEDWIHVVESLDPPDESERREYYNFLLLQRLAASRMRAGKIDSAIQVYDQIQAGQLQDISEYVPSDQMHELESRRHKTGFTRHWSTLGYLFTRVTPEMIGGQDIYDRLVGHHYGEATSAVQSLLELTRFKGTAPFGAEQAYRTVEEFLIEATPDPKALPESLALGRYRELAS